MEKEHNILLIEDSDTQALRVTAILEQEGFSVEREASAEKGLDRLASYQPDLIMVDYHLPGMEGDEFCRHIRMNPGTESTPLLMMTEDTKGEIELQGLESGADDHISKSMDADAMLARIHALLRNRGKWAAQGWRTGERFRKARILLVDDSRTYLAFLQDALEQEGYGVATALSGEDAISEVNKEFFDCIIVDLVMPGIDGIELCKRLDGFRQNAGLSFPLLMVTGQDSNDEMMRALEAGADDFVSKANDVNIIKARIRALLRRKFLQDEHERIMTEFRNKELEILRERAAREAAQEKAELAEHLELANKALEATNRELKETQGQLVQTAKMASLGELVAGIAHEINNPLSFVMNHAKTVEDRLRKIMPEVEPAMSDDGRKKWDKALLRLTEIHGGLERVHDIVIKLRTFSRLDEGEFKTVDMKENIESTIYLIRHRCKDRISITTDYAKNNILSCYPGTLNQVVMNVLANAIDAIEGEGEIKVSTRRVKGQFEITVSDTGPGIPKEIRDRVFEPFFTTKPVGAGTGLGMAICYKIIQNHGGSIVIEDGKSGGCEMIIRIPDNLSK